MRKALYFLVAAASLLAACSPRPVKTAGINYAFMDTTARAGDDFARYATGHWGDFNPQSPEYPIWGTVYKVMDDNSKALATLLREIAGRYNEEGSIARKIGDLYNMKMDSTRLNAEGAAPLKALIGKVDALQTREELLNYLATEHNDLFFSIYLVADEKDADNNIVCIEQDGLSLGNRDYYLSNDPQKVHARELMKEHMKNLFTLTGYPEADAARKVSRLWTIEETIAVPYYSKERKRIPEDNYHKISVDSLTVLCGGFPWKQYFTDYRFDKTDIVDLCQVEPVAKGCELLMSLPLEDLKTACEWRLINDYAGFLSDDFTDEIFDYESKMNGTQDKTPRWKTAESMVEDLMPDAIGQLYVEKYFPKEAKAEMLDLIENLRTALGERIKAQEWMSPETKETALDKLAACRVKVGYPDKWDDLGSLVVDSSKSLLENVREAEKFSWDLNYEKKYNKPVDKSAWDIPAQMVNAIYIRTGNEIVFPAGFLQPPLFDLNADAAANYGSIGVVIGHEMTHGFDDKGRLYDKAGNLSDWWTEADAEAFRKPCDAMVDYFNGLWVIPGEIKANGTVCLGENIADHGGLNVAFTAFQMWQQKHGRLDDDNGFTPEQRFFLSYANLWAGTISDEMLRYMTMIDDHAPAHLRVNGALAQCDYWYDAFGIQPGDSLYVAPEARVKVW